MLIFREATFDEQVNDYHNSQLTKYVGVASFTIRVWDHIITFSDEVELIWKGGKGPAVYLFFVNRYLIPLSFTVNLWAYFRNSWTEQSCGKFVRFEGAMTMIGISIVALMMFLRIRALYPRIWTVQAIVIAILLAFIGVNSWLLTRGIPVHHLSPLTDSCTMIIDPKVGSIASSTAWLPFLYDTVVVSLTLFQTGRALLSKTAGQIIRVLLREGLLYYSVICTVTLVLTIMILTADPSVRNITAQLHLCLTVTMMSRITLHLKRFAQRSTVVEMDGLRHIPRPLHPPAARTRGPPWHVGELSRLEAAPRVTFPFRRSASTSTSTSPSARARSGTVPEGESFALELISQTATGHPSPHPSSKLETSVMSVSALPVPIDLDVLMLHTLHTVGDEELACSHGRV